MVRLRLHQQQDAVNGNHQQQRQMSRWQLFDYVFMLSG
jgi:hypothetical protein